MLEKKTDLLISSGLIQIIQCEKNLSSLLWWSCKLRHLGRKFCHSSKDLGATLRHLAATQVTKHYRLWVEQKIHKNTVYIVVL